MSEIKKMYDRNMCAGPFYKVLSDVLVRMENRLEKMDQLEKDVVEARERILYLEQMNINGMEKQTELETSLEMKGRIIDTLCEQCRNFESFQARTEPCINTLLQGLGALERSCESFFNSKNADKKKAEDEHFIVSSNIDTLFRANVDRNKEYQKLTEKMEKYNRELAECNKDIIGTHMTLMKYKQENNMLDNRIDDINKENQSTENGLDVLRLKLIDVLDEVEKNTSEATEIKQMAVHIHSKNSGYDTTFGVVMQRMNELEDAMKTVTMHWSDIRSIKERLAILERTCTFCGGTAKLKHGEVDCCLDCFVEQN